MKRRSIFAASLLAILVLLSCTSREDTFEMKKLQMRQKLDDTLEEIDTQIENVVADTSRSKSSEYKQQMAKHESSLKELRKSVLQKMEQLPNVKQENWSEFTEQVDSARVDVKHVLERIRDEIDTLTQQYTLPT